MLRCSTGGCPSLPGDSGYRGTNLYTSGSCVGYTARFVPAAPTSLPGGCRWLHADRSHTCHPCTSCCLVEQNVPYLLTRSNRPTAPNTVPGSTSRGAAGTASAATAAGGPAAGSTAAAGVAPAEAAVGGCQGPSGCPRLVATCGAAEVLGVRPVTGHSGPAGGAAVPAAGAAARGAPAL